MSHPIKAIGLGKISVQPVVITTDRERVLACVRGMIAKAGMDESEVDIGMAQWERVKGMTIRIVIPPHPGDCKRCSCDGLHWNIYSEDIPLIIPGAKPSGGFILCVHMLDVD